MPLVSILFVTKCLTWVPLKILECSYPEGLSSCSESLTRKSLWTFYPKWVWKRHGFHENSNFLSTHSMQHMLYEVLARAQRWLRPSPWPQGSLSSSEDTRNPPTGSQMPWTGISGPPLHICNVTLGNILNSATMNTTGITDNNCWKRLLGMSTSYKPHPSYPLPHMWHGAGIFKLFNYVWGQEEA